MPFNGHFYTITESGKEYTVIVAAYHWSNVEKILGISRKNLKRGADSKNPMWSRMILSLPASPKEDR